MATPDPIRIRFDNRHAPVRVTVVVAEGIACYEGGLINADTFEGVLRGVTPFPEIALRFLNGRTIVDFAAAPGPCDD